MKHRRLYFALAQEYMLALFKQRPCIYICGSAVSAAGVCLNSFSVIWFRLFLLSCIYYTEDSMAFWMYACCSLWKFHLPSSCFFLELFFFPIRSLLLFCQWQQKAGLFICGGAILEIWSLGFPRSLVHNDTVFWFWSNLRIFCPWPNKWMFSHCLNQ